MHIVLTVNAAWNIANFRTPLVRALLGDGHEVTILAPRDGAVASLEQMGCRFVELAMDASGLNPFRDARLVSQFRRHFRSLAPDVVLGFTIKPNLFGAMAAKALGIPFIPNVTGLGTAFLGARALRMVATGLYRRAFDRLDTIFFQNEDDRDLFIADRMVTAEQAQLLPGSGIDLDAFAAADYPADSARTAFLMIARIIRDKGVLEYVEAARMLREEGAPVECRLLGPVGAPNRTSIPAEEVARWQSEGWIEYRSEAEDVRPAIADAHCLVLPSYREGAPRTLIEGAAMARPAITTDVTGCRMVVADGKTGLLCRARDAQDLADAMRRFAGLPYGDKAAMGVAARKRAEHMFDVAHVIAAYRDAVGRSHAAS